MSHLCFCIKQPLESSYGFGSWRKEAFLLQLLWILFCRKGTLKKHILSSNYNPLIQEWYLSSFADKQNLKKHVEAVREGIKPFKCSVCDLKFANNYNPLIQEWYLSSFADNQNLRKHVEAVLEGIKPFKCSICGLKFANNYNIHWFRNGM